jgi:7,8-dihydropterin-6-yl-methyl-4-(beta-D-ribofuranosyl)aminobenzene 5'-phosphate synthase
MQKDWDYAPFVEYRGKRILFDTDNNPDILAQNAKVKGVDLTQLNFVVMSHRHGDHMGGLTYLLKVNPTVKVHAPKEGFGVYGADLPSSFYRKDASLPQEQRYYDGTPPEVMRFGSAWPRANFQLVDKNIEIAPDIHLIALVSDKPGTLELRELSLAINTPDGMVIVVGCSHPGIDKIIESATAINPRIHFIAGGFHLVVRSSCLLVPTIFRAWQEHRKPAPTTHDNECRTLQTFTAASAPIRIMGTGEVLSASFIFPA